VETAKTNLASTMTELNSTKSAVADLATELKGKLELKIKIYKINLRI
jgi:hypothetical protein